MRNKDAVAYRMDSDTTAARNVWGRLPGDRTRRWTDRLLGPDVPGTHGTRSIATLSTRVLGHLGAWAYAVHSGSPWAGAAAVASIANDIAVARQLRRHGFRPGPIDWIVDALDAVAWGLVLGHDPAMGRPAIIADSVPTASDAAFTFAAGTVAQPEPPGAVSWPPSARTAVPLGLRVAVPALLPPLGFWLVRRFRGMKGGLGLCGWGISGAVLFGIVARNREAQQFAAIESWNRRALVAIAEEKRRSQVWAATEEHDGHAFKRVLGALAAAGSEPSRAALHHRMARPSAVIDSARSGAIVEHVARGINVLSGATVWLTASQCRELEEFLRNAEDHAVDATLDLRVRRPRPSLVEIEYLGHTLRLATESPHLERGMAPVVGGFLYATVVRAQAVSTRELPWRAAVAASCIDLAAVIVFWKYPPEGSVVPWLVAISALSNYLLVWAVARQVPNSHNRWGTPKLAAGGPLMTHAMALAFFRRQLHPRAHVCSLVALLGMFLYAAARSGLRPIELVDAAVGILMPFGMSWDLEERFQYEAAVLDDRLAAMFEERIADAHRSANEAELLALLRDVSLASQELERVAQDGALSERLITWARDEISRTREWTLAECHRFRAGQ